ncbi:class I SAM-dependent methyltransferase [Arenicella xantha]|uniref:Methyltransferase family protein n=1 Tax=Arenicella xantha TaxID=644221 RepID=A0A395JLK4_9GAMM|nr:class I SAM-dependent methyltransferase [Arenicella xantha]RBP49892.1 methyltransferase family protein [Arenicella xantha]
MKHDSVVEENKRFYNAQYQNKNLFLVFLHTLVSFDQQSKARVNARVLLPVIDEFLSTNDSGSVSLLDFGCGWGSLLLKMPKRIQLYCFDLSSQAMTNVCKILSWSGRSVIPARIEDSSILEPAELDFITCSHVLEHVSDDESILLAFHASLSDQGVLLINVPINEVWDDPKHVRPYTRASLRQLLIRCGFEPMHEEACDKWTGYFLEKQFVGADARLGTRVIIRCAKLVLALTPLKLVEWSERRFFEHREPQQLIVLARKARY